jgi:aminoglycoside phosphotransferase (APT) family kinase protein
LPDDAQLDATQVASLVQVQFPELSPAHVAYLGEGCDSSAFEVNRQWVFRFPKRADVAQQLAVESRILPVLAEQSPLPLPIFCFHGRPSAAHPYHFVGYQKLPGVAAIQLDGRTMPITSWAPTMGRFLSWLHQFPVGRAEALGVPSEDVAALIDEVRRDALDDFELLYDVIEAAPFEEWRAFFAAECQPPGPVDSGSVLVHRDLASEHVLFDPARQEVTGILDWSDIAISDRAVDLAGFFHWGGRPCIDAVLSVYEGPVDEGVLARARFLAACRGVGDVAFGLKTRRQEYLKAGFRALVLCLGGGSSRMRGLTGYAADSASDRGRAAADA